MTGFFSADGWLNTFISGINNILWTYILVAVLIACAILFTIKTRGVQFRMVGEMIRLLGDSTKKTHEKHVSSFEAFAVSIASRVGTGNLAGVATAIAVGGPGAIFWMWIIALLGSATAFVESTLAQLYKRKTTGSYIGGPAYYMMFGLKKRLDGTSLCRPHHSHVLYGLYLYPEQHHLWCHAGSIWYRPGSWVFSLSSSQPFVSLAASIVSQR